MYDMITRKPPHPILLPREKGLTHKNLAAILLKQRIQTGEDFAEQATNAFNIR